MSAFDYAWAILKQDDSYERAQEHQRILSEYNPDIGSQIYPAGNLPAYHQAIIGLMRRKNMQDTFNEGRTREQFEHEKQFEDYPGELEWFERDDFQDELGDHPIDDAEERAGMNFDEMTGRITRESTGHARAPSDKRIDARANQQLMEEGRPSMKQQGYARDMFHPRFGDFYSGR
tara:strand:- start:620 stop:1144 length:525 start_codon:yes stop_codon:yes gene_type:complete